MRKKIRVFFLILMISFFALKSDAGVLIDPYLGYLFPGNATQGPGDSFKFHGPVYGIRGGFQETVMLGFDFGKSYLKFKRGKPVYVLPRDYSGTYFSFFAGVSLPAIPLRFWASYYLYSEYEDGEGRGSGDSYLGDGYGATIGFTGIPFLSLNLEFRMFRFDRFEDAISGEKTDLEPDLLSNEILLTVSVPLVF